MDICMPSATAVQMSVRHLQLETMYEHTARVGFTCVVYLGTYVHLNSFHPHLRVDKAS